MRNRRYITVAVIFFVVLSGTSGAVENPAVSDPAGTGRVPMSSIRSGLVTRPNPIDTGSNLIVTGQVSGGKHFRGVLPYNVDRSFGGRLGSSTLDSFLRYSSGSGNIGRPPGTYEPYYSQTGTVTTMMPGYSRVFTPPTPSGEFKNYVIDGRVDPTVPKTQSSDLEYHNTGAIGLRPMSMSQEQIEKIISNDMSNYLKAKREADEHYRSEMEQFKIKLEQITEQAAEPKQIPTIQDSLLQLFPKAKPDEDEQQQGDSQMPTEQSDQDVQLDVYEQMKRQIKQLQGQLEEPVAAIQTQQTEEAADDQERSDDGISRLGDSEKKSDGETSRTADGENKSDSEISQTDVLPELYVSIAARDILGQYESFAAYTQDKFNQYMRAAEMYLKEGKYYRAADAYTLASIYKLDDPLAYAGKSHALFAAGEYMSSALFLSRALEIFPEYAWFKIDLVSMIMGGKDLLENRIADIEEWVDKNRAGELQFLLAYFYYQMGRLVDAKDNVESARIKILDSKAVLALRQAIDDAMKTDGPINR